VLSVVIGVTLHRGVGNDGVALDHGGVGATVPDDRWPVELQLVVDNQQRVGVVDNVIIDTHTVQVLLEQILEESVFLLKSGLLLFDGQLVKQDLVVTLVELVQVLELLVSFLVEALDLVDADLGLVLDIRVRLVERKDLFFLRFKLAA